MMEPNVNPTVNPTTLKTLRQQAGLSMREAGELIGFVWRSIFRWERDCRGANPIVLQAYCAKLHEIIEAKKPLRP